MSRISITTKPTDTSAWINRALADVAGEYEQVHEVFPGTIIGAYGVLSQLHFCHPIISNLEASFAS